jgi:hypothetical protein
MDQFTSGIEDAPIDPPPHPSKGQTFVFRLPLLLLLLL